MYIETTILSPQSVDKGNVHLLVDALLVGIPQQFPVVSPLQQAVHSVGLLQVLMVQALWRHREALY